MIEDRESRTLRKRLLTIVAPLIFVQWLTLIPRDIDKVNEQILVVKSRRAARPQRERDRDRER
jgi:hypothetical protein